MPTFTNILRKSIFRQITHKATCQTCKQFSTFVSQRSASSGQLPPILAVNASVYDEESLSFWQDYRGSTFLQPKISLRGQVAGVDDTAEVVFSIRVWSSLLFNKVNILIQSAKAMVIKVARKDKKSHLAAIIKGPFISELNLFLY